MSEEKDRRRQRLILAALFALALAARVIAVFAISNFDDVTGFENEAIAENLLAGRGYSFAQFGRLGPTAFMYPLYTFYLAAVFFLFGHSWMWAELGQALAGALGAPLLMLLGRRMFDATTGLLAGLFFALHPVYVYWVTQGQSLTFDVVVLIGMCLAWDRGLDAKNMKLALVSGLLLGVGMLAKTLYLAFFPAFAIWAWLKTASPALALRFSALALAAGLLAVAPWTVRNYIRFDRFILVTDNTGFNLWLGNNPNATGGLYATDGKHLTTTISPQLRQKLEAAPNSPARDDLFMEEARAFIRQNPAKAIAIAPGRLRALWYFEPHMPSRFDRFRKILYIVTLPFAIAGIFLARKNIRRLSLFPLMYAAMTLVYAVFFGQARFRFAIEWSFLLFAAYAVSRVIHRKRNHP